MMCVCVCRHVSAPAQVFSINHIPIHTANLIYLSHLYIMLFPHRFHTPA